MAIRAFDADRRNSIEAATNAARESLRGLIASAMPATSAQQPAAFCLMDNEKNCASWF